MSSPSYVSHSHFNPRSSCEERHSVPIIVDSFLQISIHAPHARSDAAHRRPRRQHSHFNPRSSCEERLLACSHRRLCCRFQSTLLMRGATLSALVQDDTYRDFNPRSSCEERLKTLFGGEQLCYFNPRSSCEERPGQSGYMLLTPRHFNPRSSCEERLGFCAIACSSVHFNPRSSCEERHTCEIA